MPMTREEHLKWCKERAIGEYDFYSGEDKQLNGLASMMSDLGKHPETGGPALIALCLMQMHTPMTRAQFVAFINGFR